jgi:hypothetical protein
MKRYGYAWVTLAFFLFSLALHWAFGWGAYVDEAREHGQTPEVMAWAIEMGRDTFENWQSEFLQLLWQVVGLAYLLYVGSPSSKENDDRMEAKLDALLQLVGKERGEELIDAIDERHERRGGHAGLHAEPPLEEAAHKPAG